MKIHYRDRGSVLTMVLGFVVVVAVAAFVTLNYAQILGVQKQAQSAVAASVLQVAKDAARAVVDDSNLGRIALVDDAPTNNEPNLRPVIGINTLYATIRLDLIIAKAVGNNAMVALC